MKSVWMKYVKTDGGRLMTDQLKVMLFTLVITVSVTSVAAGEMVSGFGRDKPVTVEEYRPRPEDKEAYTEEWNFNVYLEDGTFIAADFGVSNLAFTSDNDGMFSAKIRDPKGKYTRCKVDLDDDEWKYSKSGFSLDFRKGKVTGDLNKMDVEVKCKNLSMDLHFNNQVPPYKPGNGVLRYGDDGIYRVMFPCPRAHVTGTVSTKDGKRQIEGVGHAMHTHSNIRPDKRTHRWFRFKIVNKDISIIMAEEESTEKYLQAHNGWVLVLDSTGSLIDTARVRFEFDGFIKDEKSEGGYRIPRRVRIVAVDGNRQLVGVLLMKDIMKVVDPTEDLGAVKRAVVRRFSKPKDYHINCTYKLTVKTAEGNRLIQGDGYYRFVYVNP